MLRNPGEQLSSQMDSLRARPSLPLLDHSLTE